MVLERFLPDIIHLVTPASRLLLTETLPWQRTSDLHVMLSAAVVAMLGWRFDKERLWEVFHQEEGRYVSAAPTISSPGLCGTSRTKV